MYNNTCVSSGVTSTEMIYKDMKWSDLFMENFWEVLLTYRIEFLVCTTSCLSVVAVFVLWTQTDKIGVPATRCRPDHRIKQPEDVTWNSAPTVSSYLPNPPPKNRRSRYHRYKRRNKSVEILSPTVNTPLERNQNTSKETHYTDYKRHINCQETIDLDAMKDQPHIQAVRQNYPEVSWISITTALVYLHKFSALAHKSKIIMKALDHIKDLMERPGSNMERYLGHNIPVDYTETELWEIVSFHHGDMKEEEFLWVYQEFRRENGFPPTVTEFCLLYEKSIQTAKMKKIHTKLRKKYEKSQECIGNLRKELEKKQQENVDLKLKLSQLELLKTRSLCKICLQNEISVLFLPCGHAVSCRACFNDVTAKLKRKQMCPICTSQVKTTKYLYLA